MTVTFDLPDALAASLLALPETERNRFAVAALYRYTEEDAAENDETVAIVEAALADMEAGRNLVSFDEVRRSWATDSEVRLSATPIK